MIRRFKACWKARWFRRRSPTVPTDTSNSGISLSSGNWLTASPYRSATSGSKGTALAAFAQQLDQFTTAQMALGSQLLQQVKNPFQGLVSSGPLAGATVAAGQLLRPEPQYNGFNVEAETNRNSIYHSLEVKMEKRFHNAGTVLASYTFSKLIANVDQPDTWLEKGGSVGGGIGAVQDTYNLAAERGLSSFDARSRLVTSYALDFPIGKGKKLLGNVNSIVDKFVSGWGMDGVTTFQKGTPLFFAVAANTSNSYNAGPLQADLRPNVVGGFNSVISGSAQSRVNKWFNTSCFAAPGVVYIRQREPRRPGAAHRRYQ